MVTNQKSRREGLFFVKANEEDPYCFCFSFAFLTSRDGKRTDI